MNNSTKLEEIEFYDEYVLCLQIHDKSIRSDLFTRKVFFLEKLDFKYRSVFSKQLFIVSLTHI